VDVVLHDGQLILSVLQLWMSIVEEVGLEITTVISPHQLIVQLLDTCLKAVVHLEELPVALLDVLDEKVLGRHLVVVLIQAPVTMTSRNMDLMCWA
jgi:hypothetical protein